MNILAVVELSDCARVCLGSVQDSEGGGRPENPDTCVAVAGILHHPNASIGVRKYCVPKALSLGVRSQPFESWSVWDSEGWSNTVLSLAFTDTQRGDTLLAYRDNRGGYEAQGPAEQLISLHPRYVQSDDGGAIYASQYSTPLDRSERLTLLSGVNPQRPIVGIDRTRSDLLAMVDVHVMPSPRDQLASWGTRLPWVLATLIVVDRHGAPGASSGVHESREVEVCGAIDVDAFVRTRGASGFEPSICDTGGILGLVRLGSYAPVHLPDPTPSSAQLLLVPTVPGHDMQLVDVGIVDPVAIASVTRRPFGTPRAFSSGVGLPPSSASWEALSRASGLLSNTRSGSRARQSARQSQGGGPIVFSRGRTLAQNSLTPGFFLSEQGAPGTVLVFATNDPDAPSHWLTQLRMRLSGGAGEVQPEALVADTRASHAVQVTVTVLESCDRTSCLGCPDLRLQTLCYAARQCSVARCIGTVVNQRYFLCDAGLAMQSLADQAVSQTLGAWLIFTDTYAEILRLSLASPGAHGDVGGFDVEWVDDAFFGYVCSAKDMYGQFAGAITASIGYALSPRASRGSVGGLGASAPAQPPGGANDVDNRRTARTAMTLNGINSFLYHLALLPLYPMIASQRVFVCTANSMLAVVEDVSGFSITLGRGDLQNASSIAAGACLTSFHESNAEDIARPDSESAIASGATELLSGSYDALQGASRVSRSAGRLFSRISAVQMRVPMHFLDAMITWATGVVSGLQDMTQALDATNCDVPDYFIHRATSCACGDDPVQIPAPRRRGSPYWCTGTLEMLDPFGEATYVHNPYTYEQLRVMLAGGRMDAYLRCISRLAQQQQADDGVQQDCASIEPRDDAVTPQGVSLISVFQRCKANYQQMQWDEGAWMIHDQGALNSHIGSVDPPAAWPSDDPEGVGACLLARQADGEGSLGCMQESIAMPRGVYFRYERLSSGGAAADTTSVDACLVFTGPARELSRYGNDTDSAIEFRRCSADYPDDTGCRIPHMVWSPASPNKVRAPPPLSVSPRQAIPCICHPHPAT